MAVGQKEKMLFTKILKIWKNANFQKRKYILIDIFYQCLALGNAFSSPPDERQQPE